jgi:MFS transporter, OPA family, glycerol-3-phosphate transporter
MTSLNGPDLVQARRFRLAQWRILLATMFCYLFFYTGRQTFGFAIPGIQEELGISKTTLGWVSTAMLWCYAIGQAVNGNLGDQFGGRRMMSLGAWLSCGLNWIVSFGGSLLTLAVPWSINGFAQSMAWAPGSRVLANWWSHTERGKVYGFYVFSAGLASVLAYVTSNLILSYELDWRWIFRLPVLLMLVGGTAYYLLVRDHPEDLGYLPLDAHSSRDAESATDGEHAAQQPDDEPIFENEPPPDETAWERYAAVLSNWGFLVACVAIGFQSMARYGLLIWVPVHFLGESWKESRGSAWISVALPVGMALGALASGWISDRLFSGNRSRPIALFMMLAAASSLVMYGLPTHSKTGMVMLFFCGFFAYGPQSAFWALCPDLLGRKRAGTGTGVMNTFAYAFAGLGEPFIGRMIESNGDRTELVFVIVAAACLISAASALLIRR